MHVCANVVCAILALKTENDTLLGKLESVNSVLVQQKDECRQLEQDKLDLQNQLDTLTSTFSEYH